jgi:hypothetical protein
MMQGILPACRLLLACLSGYRCTVVNSPILNTATQTPLSTQAPPPPHTHLVSPEAVWEQQHHFVEAAKAQALNGFLLAGRQGRQEPQIVGALEHTQRHCHDARVCLKVTRTCVHTHLGGGDGGRTAQRSTAWQKGQSKGCCQGVVKINGSASKSPAPVCTRTRGCVCGW